MPSGAGVIKYEGARGVTWYVKYRDADGRQIKERLGHECDGWNRKKAQAELRERLVRVERKDYKRPRAVEFAAFADEWLDNHAATKGLKASTVETYRGLLTHHLKPAFEKKPISAIDVVVLERLIADMRKKGYAAATCNRVLNVWSLIEKAAVKRGHHSGAAATLVSRPREDRRRWRILSPEEVRAVERAFGELLASADGDELSVWLRLSLDMFLVSYGLGLRRGELLGLRWRRVHLADPAGPSLRIDETFVRNRIDTPKSAASERTIALGPRLAEVLFGLRARTPYSGDDERVFAHPQTGGAVDPKRYARYFRQALVTAGIDDYIRPTHDGRHSSITNAAAAGMSPAALMSRAGHADFSTTKRYIDLAGETFRGEAERLEERLWGPSGTKNRYQVVVPENAQGAVLAP